MDYDYDLEDDSALAKKLQLEIKIRATKQGNRDVQELFDDMLSLWDQKSRLEPTELTRSRSYRKSQEENQLIQFLLALRHEFEPLKRSLLSSVPVPSLQVVVGLLKAEEARLKSSSGFSKGKGKLVAENNDGLFSKFSSLKTEESHQPALSGGVVGNIAKFAAASLAAAGVSWAISDYITGSEESNSVEDSSTLKVLTYNVCFWELELEERMEALGLLIQSHAPDIICFQEVTSSIYNIFRRSNWWDEYNCSVSPYDATMSKPPYFCMQLSKLPVRYFMTKPFRNSRMGRELCMANIQVGMGKSLIVATSHLESPTSENLNSQERVAQAKEALNFLETCQNVIFCGDMNWNDEVDGRLPLAHRWTDAWAELRPCLKGWTYDTKTNQMLAANRPLQKRLDRFLSKLNDFKLEGISMIGTEAIPGITYLKNRRRLPVFPSDHYGLLLEIR